MGDSKQVQHQWLKVLLPGSINNLVRLHRAIPGNRFPLAAHRIDGDWMAFLSAYGRVRNHTL
jgi:hypothetical protein